MDLLWQVTECLYSAINQVKGTGENIVMKGRLNDLLFDNANVYCQFDDGSIICIRKKMEKDV